MPTVEHYLRSSTHPPLAGVLFLCAAHQLIEEFLYQDAVTAANAE
jgi:hypothetical protein